MEIHLKGQYAERVQSLLDIDSSSTKAQIVEALNEVQQLVSNHTIED